MQHCFVTAQFQVVGAAPSGQPHKRIPPAQGCAEQQIKFRFTVSPADMNHFMAENQLQFLHGICALRQNNAGAAGKQADGHRRLHCGRLYQPVMLFPLPRMVPLPSQQVQNVRLRHRLGLRKHHIAESQMCANPPQHNRRETRKPDDSQSHKPPPRQLQNHARYSDTIRPIETKMQIIGQHPQDGANRWPQAAAQQGQKRHQTCCIQTQLE